MHGTALHLRLRWARVFGSAQRMRGSPDFPVGFPGRAGFLSLPPVREAERRNGASNTWGTFAKAPRLPCEAGAPSGAPPRRFIARPPYKVDRIGSGRTLPLLQAVLPQPFARSRPAIEGSPLIRGGRRHRTLGRGERSHACRRHTLLRQPSVPSRRPQRARQTASIPDSQKCKPNADPLPETANALLRPNDDQVRPNS